MRAGLGPDPRTAGVQRASLSHRQRRLILTGLLLVLPFLLSACAESRYHWNWNVVLPIDPRGVANSRFLIAGFWSTISISVLATAISMVIGILVALMGTSKRRVLIVASRIYVEGFRAVPVLVMILWVYYGLPILTGLKLSVFATGLVSLAISDSAFTSEIFRSGLQSIHRSQGEAALSLGLTWRQMMRLVILPQVVRRVLPALGNQFVYVLKMSSLVSVVGLQELTRRANELNLQEQRPLEIYSLLVLEYLVLILIVSWGVRVMERRLKAGVYGHG